MPPLVKSLPKSQRPREKLISRGPQALTSQELLAIILGSGQRGRDILALSQAVLRKIGTKKLDSSSYFELKKIKGLGPAKACTIMAAIELGRRIFSSAGNAAIIVENLADVLNLVSDLRLKKKEYVVALLLNSRNELVAKEEIVVGGANTTFLAPSDLFRPAIEHNASQVILVHNHPSGSCEPSEDDLKLTARLIQAGNMLGINLLDHVIISQKEGISLRRSHPELFS